MLETNVFVYYSKPYIDFYRQFKILIRTLINAFLYYTRILFLIWCHSVD